MRKSQKNREEGATMIVVMILLLSVTALALFSIHTTTYELRASGHARVMMQADTVADTGLTTAIAGLDVNGPVELMRLIDENQNAVGQPTMAPFEPELLAHKKAYRMYSPDFSNFTSADAIHNDAIGGTAQPYDPFFTVDINDHRTMPGGGAPAGNAQAGGSTNLTFAIVTYTARGRLRLRTGDHTPTGDPREYHETASNARAFGIIGPLPAD